MARRVAKKKARRLTPAMLRYLAASASARGSSSPSAAGLATYSPSGVPQPQLERADYGNLAYGGPAAPPLPQQPFNVLVPLGKALLPDLLQQMPSSIQNALPSLASALPALPAVMAVDKLVSALPVPLQVVASTLFVGPSTLKKIPGVVADALGAIGGVVGNILGGGGYTPEELAKNQSILMAQASAGQRPGVSTRPAATPQRTRETF